MALTVRPDDEVYQFDTVWLGPDEYTLPIQARYVAWGTWLASFLVAVVILVPLGGGGPGGVLGSLVWSLAVSVVLSRAVMLVVDHERPLRSLPALFSAEARAAVAARRRGERSLLLRVDKITVRDTPAKVLEMRRRDHERAARKAAKRRPDPHHLPEEELGPDWRTGPVREEWAADEWDEPGLAWSVTNDGPGADDRVPVPAAVAVHEVMEAEIVEESVPEEYGRHDRPEFSPGPFRQYPAVPVTVSPTRGRHAARDDEAPAQQSRDRQAAVEARILLPARKDR